jgi:hypothetical protein
MNVFGLFLVLNLLIIMVHLKYNLKIGKWQVLQPHTKTYKKSASGYIFPTEAQARRDGDLFSYCHRHASKIRETDFKVPPDADWDTTIPEGVEWDYLRQVVTRAKPIPARSKQSKFYVNYQLKFVKEHTVDELLEDIKNADVAKIRDATAIVRNETEVDEDEVEARGKRNALSDAFGVFNEAHDNVNASQADGPKMKWAYEDYRESSQRNFCNEMRKQLKIVWERVAPGQDIDQLNDML